MQTDAIPPLMDSATTSNRVTSVVREAILSGRLKPGETLIERQLAQMLGVSKTPVREALIALTSSGLVVSSPNRGVTVRELSTDDVRQVYEVRLLLEPWAVARTTQRRSPERIERIRTALEKAKTLLDDESEDLLNSAESRTLSLTNREFHRELYAGCGNDLIITRLDQLQDLTALSTLSVLWKQWPTWRAEFDEHIEIFKMVEAGDYESAERAVSEHIQNSVTRLSGSPYHEATAAVPSAGIAQA